MIEPIKLHAYVDGELNDAERREVESRLAECPASQAEVASIRSLKSAMSQVSPEECEAVWSACKTRLDAIDRVAKSGNFITKYSWAFVSAVALFVIVGGGYARHTQAGSVDSSALAGIFSNSSRMTPEKAVRNAELDEILQRAKQQLSKLTIVHDTNLIIDGQLARRVDLQDASGPMSLVVLPQVTSFEGMNPDSDGSYYFGQIDSEAKAVGWKAKNTSFVLVGQRDYQELKSIAQKYFVLPE